MASATKEILETIRDQLKRTATIRELVGEKVFVMIDPNAEPPEPQFVPPFLIVSPGEVRTSRVMGDPTNRQEIVAIAVTAYVMYATDEERLLIGPRGDPGLLDMIDAVDTLIDNGHRKDLFTGDYERCDKTGEGAAVPAYAEGEDGGSWYARKTITFGITCWQDR